MLIYKVQNKVNNKVYIGMTTLTLEERKKEHFKKFKGSRPHALYAAFSRYGWDNFEWQEIVSVLDEKHLPDLEKYFISYYNSLRNGYNMTEGGEGVINGAYEKYYLVRFPNGEEHIIKGMKKFCRENNLNEGSLYLTWKPSKKYYTKKDGTTSVYLKSPKKQHKGFVLLGRFNDHPGREYAQAGGKGGHPYEDDDMVSSAWKHAAA